tara:strand:- start:128 stop:373 length:246 start_codon:yes stop_codon:yes gene_type:complete
METSPIAIRQSSRKVNTFPGKPNIKLFDNSRTNILKNENDKNNNYEQSIFDPNQASPPNHFLEKLELRIEKYYASKKVNNE